MNDQIKNRATAAWSRDSLAAWQWMLDNTEPMPHIGTHPNHCQFAFLRRWAVKILCLVNMDLGYCDWYWFLSNQFDKELKRVDPDSKPLRDIMFTGPDFETDPLVTSK